MKHEVYSTSAEVITAMKGGAENVGSHHAEPDDDWAPALFASIGGELVVIGLVGLPPDADERAEVVRQAFFHLGAKPKVVGCVLSTWSYEEDKPDDRREMLIVQAVDSHKHLVQVAQINRWEGRPPTLGAWEKWDGASLLGPMVEVFHDAVSR